MTMTPSAEMARRTGRKTPRKEPPENRHGGPEEGPKCEDCVTVYEMDDLETEKVEHDDGAVSREVRCPECGDTLWTELLKEPDTLPT